MTQTFFVSDLHLDHKKPHVIAAFCRFLEGISGADALYILGDLFDYWIGDDDPAIGLKPVMNSLRELTLAGTPAFFIHGNRDFLVGKAFANYTQCKILPETSIVSLYGTPTIIMHGDTLCTDDVAYQKYRAKARSKWVQKTLLLLSTKQRLKIAARLRDKSASAIRGKQPEIMDVNQNTVEQVMLSHKVQCLIHGHTHRPAIHNFTINGNAYKRIVLGDWYETAADQLSSTQDKEQAVAWGSVLKCTPDEMKLEKIRP